MPRVPRVLRRKRVQRAALGGTLLVLGWALLKDWVGGATFNWAQTKYGEVQEGGRREAQAEKWSEDYLRRAADESARQDAAQARAAQAQSELLRAAKVPAGSESQSTTAEMEMRAARSQAWQIHRARGQEQRADQPTASHAP